MQRLILAGGGHAHLGVMQALARHRPPNTEIMLITPREFATYSGMLPGWMSGHYELSQCRIDLRRLAAAAKVNLVVSSVAGMDAERRVVAVHDANPLEYDFLSLNVGGESDLSLLQAANDLVLPVRPLDTFIERWSQVLEAAARRSDYRLAVVGGGAGGVELAFAATQAFVRRRICAEVTLIAATGGLLPGHAPGVIASAAYWLQRQGVCLRQALAVGTEHGLALSTGELLTADCIIAATGSRAPCWLRVSSLALDDQGFVQVNATHQSISHPDVFATGDVCSRIDMAVAHSGVHAVRSGKVLGRNLIKALSGGTLEPYLPHKRSLYLLATGPRHAISSWGTLSAAGRWVWRLKDWIDRRFVNSFRINSREKHQ